MISELNKWKKFDFYTVLCFNHTLLTEILIGYNSSSHEEYKNREKMDLKDGSIIELEFDENIIKLKKITSHVRSKSTPKY